MTIGGFVVAILVGMLVGWIASLVMRADTQPEILFDIGMGAVGGVVGPLILFASSILDALLAAFLSAALFMVILILVRRTQV